MESKTATHTIVESSSSSTPPKLVLRLKEKKNKITWTDDTIDNEHLKKRSSKRCCIYHKSKAFAESDSDESDSDTEKAKKQVPPPGRPKNYQRHHA